MVNCSLSCYTLRQVLFHSVLQRSVITGGERSKSDVEFLLSFEETDMSVSSIPVRHMVLCLVHPAVKYGYLTPHKAGEH